MNGTRIGRTSTTNSPSQLADETSECLTHRESGPLCLKDVAKSIVGIQSQLGDDYFGDPEIKLTAKNADEDLLLGAMRGELNRLQRGISCGASVTQTNLRGLTPLMMVASSSGNEAIESATILLKYRSEIHHRDHQGWTCLHHAVRNGKAEMAKHLLKARAEPHINTGDGRTVLMLAAMEGKVEVLRDLLRWKARIEKMVSDKDAAGCTALHFAARKGILDCMKLLIERSCKVHAKDVEGRDSLMWACEHSNFDCAKYLVRRTADVNLKCRSQNTPLMYACLAGSDSISALLVEKQSDPMVMCSEGTTPATVVEGQHMVKFKLAVKRRCAQMLAAADDEATPGHNPPDQRAPGSRP